jgi:hypothetical protein
MEVSDKGHASAALPRVDLEDLENSPQYPLNRRPVEPVNRYNCGSERKTSAPPKIEPLTSGFPPRGLVKLTRLARSWKDEVAYATEIDGEPSNLRYK